MSAKQETMGEDDSIVISGGGGIRLRLTRDQLNEEAEEAHIKTKLKEDARKTNKRMPRGQSVTKDTAVDVLTRRTRRTPRP